MCGSIKNMIEHDLKVCKCHFPSYLQKLTFFIKNPINILKVNLRSVIFSFFRKCNLELRSVGTKRENKETYTPELMK